MRIGVLLLCLVGGLAACSPVVTGNKSPCFGQEVMVGCYFEPLGKPTTMNFSGD